MNVLSYIISVIGLLTIGYFALKEGFHKETAQQKFIKSTEPPQVRKFPKWYAALLGVACWVAAFYFVIKLLIRVVV